MDGEKAGGRMPTGWANVRFAVSVGAVLVLAAALSGCGSATDQAIRPIGQSGSGASESSAITDPSATSVKSATTTKGSGASTTAKPAGKKSSKTTTTKPDAHAPTTRGKVVTTVTVDPKAPGAKKPTNGAPLVSITTTTRPDGKSPTYEVDHLPNAALVFSNKPMKAPSASRAADGTVTSAGGYVARTIQTANGMLLEPKWTKAEQPTVDIIHAYIDEWFLAEADDDLTPGPSQAMLDLEDPHGEIAPTEPLYAKDPYDSHIHLDAYQRDGDVTRVPVGSKSYVYVKNTFYGDDSVTGKSRLIYWYACSADDMVGVDLKSGEVTDAGFSSAYHEYATGPNSDPGGIWIMGQRHSTSGRGTCG